MSVLCQAVYKALDLQRCLDLMELSARREKKTHSYLLVLYKKVRKPRAGAMPPGNI